MKRLRHDNINTPEYADSLHTEPLGGLRQEKYLENVVGSRVIELGCGTSLFAQLIVEEGLESWGLDHSPKTIEKIRLACPKVNYVVGDALATPFKDGFFDTVVAGELIEHFENPQALIDEMARISQIRMIISTPHLEFDDPEHIWEFTEDDLHEMMKQYGEVETFTTVSERFTGRRYIFAICTKR